MATTPRGVRSVSERIIQEGRALIITSASETAYDWADIPNGSIFVNTDTGALMVKLAGHSNWVPLPDLLKNGTNSLLIARDGKIVTEVFTARNVNAVINGFKYIQFVNSDDEYVYCPVIKDEVTGLDMCVIELKGSYMPKRNQLTVKLNDTFERSAASGGIVELTNRKIGILDDIISGDELTVEYYMRMDIGNPYPRVYMSKYLPDAPEEGDFWLDLTEPPAHSTYPEKIVTDGNTRYKAVKR